MNNKNQDKGNRKQVEIPGFINYEDAGDSESYNRNLKKSLADQVNSYYEDSDTGSNRNPPQKKKGIPKLIKGTVLVLFALTLICGFMMFTKPGQKLIINLAGNYIYGNLQYQPAGSDADTESEETANLDTQTTKIGPVINILLIGIEEIEGAQNTDSMIIATMNTETHTLKLTSLMRDLYVDIPGHDKSKLNSAYAKGGIELLYDTIETNFGIRVDGYTMVNFKAFEQIVDMVGGVEISLTKEEAHYLNTTNYISKKSNRHVVEGPQIMNGNQAMGYCRVRKVSTGTENNDFGRTQRQRIVLQAIYDKVKSKNIVSLVLLMNKILTDVEIRTDIRQDEFNSYLQEAVNVLGTDIQTLRLPKDGSFENEKVKMGKYNVEVLVPKDWDELRAELHNFVYK